MERRRLFHAIVGVVLLALPGCTKAKPASAPAPPGPLERLRLDLEALIDREGHLRGTWGVVVHSISRDERLYERNPRALLVPASAMKLVSLAAAAEAVGWDFSFETHVFGTGPIANGALAGDLVIVGSGDPTVLGRGADQTLGPWIDALRRHGISRIEGNVIADDDAVEEPRPGFAWSWEDLGYGYGVMPGALNLAENTLAVTVTPAAAEGLPAIVELPREARDLPLVNSSATAPPGMPRNLWPELRPGGDRLSINGVIALGDSPVTLSVAAGNPTLWVARAVRNHLLAAGIDVGGAPVDVDDLPVKPVLRYGTLLHVHRSPPLAEIARPLVKESINLYAEAVLRLATGLAGERSTAAGLDAVRAKLESWGMTPDGIQMVDGSGLSRRDVLSAEALVALLGRFHDSSSLSPWMQSMAVAGRDGTLATRMRGTAAEGNAIGKSGSMSNIRTLAGYVTTADREPLAFAILANNFEGAASAVTGTIDLLVERLASFSRTGVPTATADPPHAGLLR